MTDKTAMEIAEERLSPKEQKELEFAHQRFLDQSVTEDELRSYLRFHLGFSSEAAEEYVNAACDACDSAPAVPCSPNAQLAPRDPVETRRPILKPRYG